MTIHLVDINATLVDAWLEHFAGLPDVEIQYGDILQVVKHCLVSPANSHGFMDGGIDDQYRRFFGQRIERTVQDAILRRDERMLPVGASLVVHTGHPRVPYLIVAPTMEMPEAVLAHHSGRAFRAVLRMIETHPEIGAHVYCPGLGTLTGRVAPADAAREMAVAYRSWIHQRR